ncbi:DUF6795 domain-containing protein [Aliikangiella sp. IMCC44359]|uniref:DUF6795 domain-containing protein n=1 Tax=Aliikangiella sp. IMCC44359 TaxID=3459125 RepID=UPI00403AA8EE
MTKAKNYRVILILLLIGFSLGGVAMSILDAGKVCLFSKISGVVMLDGKPAVNAKVVRTVNLSKDITDQTTTDDKGYFEMPAVYTRTIGKYLPQEFVASQLIEVSYQEKKYEIWSSVKRSPEENTESRGKPLNVECELNSERGLIMIDRVGIFSRCKWDVEPDPKEEFF